MKKIISLSILLILGIVSFVWAAPKHNSNPFKEIWSVINDLQEKIDNIQLVSGPQGPQGEQGPQGITGAGDIKFIYHDHSSNTFNILKNDGKEYGWNKFISEWEWEPAYDVPISADDIIQWQRSFFLDKYGNVWSLLNGWHIIYNSNINN